MPIDSQHQRQILQSYEVREKLYGDYCRVLSGLIQALLEPKEIQIHSISFRPKTYKSLEQKISRPDKSYSSLEEITDLAGVRITTYFADDVDRVANAIRDEFFIDQQASIDKRLYIDPNRFGYMSLHYVVSFSSGRADLLEYAKFKNLKCEIQVRSILQHAWAEIEHDLGYKSDAGVPSILKRKFARVASLLELADDEFSSIRTELIRYESSVSEKIRLTPQTVELDLPSLRSLYADSSSALYKLDQLVADAANFTIVDESPNYAARLLPRLKNFGITTVQALETIAEAEKSIIVKFTRYWRNGEDNHNVSQGIGIFYVLYYLAWKTNDIEKATEYFAINNIGQNARDSAEKLMGFKVNSEK